MQKKLLLIICLFITHFYLEATHIVGGEIILTHLSDDQYSLNLYMYFDDIHGNPNALDNSVILGIFSKSSNNLINTFTLPLISDEFLDYSNPRCHVGSSPVIRTRELIYSLTISMPSSIYNEPDGYYIIYDRCCRNHDILNIQNPGNTGSLFYLEIPPVIKNGILFRNSTPKSIAHVGDFACLNKPFSFDFSSTDDDGDLLEYSLVVPLKGHSTSGMPNPLPNPAPYPEISFSPGYSLGNMILGNPPLSIDSKIGDLTVTPSELGLFAFAVKCEEFRGGIKIGEVRKDFQMLVVNCLPATKPNILVHHEGQKYIKGDIITLYEGQNNQCIDVKGYDADTNSQFLIENFIKSVSDPSDFDIFGDTNKIIQPPDTANFQICLKLCPKFLDQVYELKILLGDNSCPKPLYDTAIVLVKVVSIPNDLPVLNFPSLEYDAQNNTFIANVVVNQTITFPVVAEDQDGDMLKISAQGKDFDLNDVNMHFPYVEGKAPIQSTFSWLPECRMLGENGDTKVYQIKFFIEENKICQRFSKDSVNVRITLNNTIRSSNEEFPNVFTPNNDSFNEAFRLDNIPSDLCFDEFLYVIIFNRWGEEVFKSNDKNFQWDGKDYSNGTYFYALVYQQSIVKGTVHLIK